MIPSAKKLLLNSRVGKPFSMSGSFGVAGAPSNDGWETPGGALEIASQARTPPCALFIGDGEYGRRTLPASLVKRCRITFSIWLRWSNDGQPRSLRYRIGSGPLTTLATVTPQGSYRLLTGTFDNRSLVSDVFFQFDGTGYYDDWSITGTPT